MKLILASAGFYTGEIVAKCEELVGKSRDSISVAVINESYAVEHENNLRWVYVGSSAGGMVLGKRLSAEAYEKIYREKGKYGITKFMELVNIALMPHLDSSHFPNRKKILLDAAKKHSGVIYGLRDDSAVVVVDDNIDTIGSEPCILN